MGFREYLRRFVKKHPVLLRTYRSFRDGHLFEKSLKKDIKGKNNTLAIDASVRFINCTMDIEGNANEIVMEMAHEVLTITRDTPVLAGVNGTDPFCIFDKYLDDVKAIGFSGIQNFPTVGLIDGSFRANLEETGMSYGLEVDVIALAHQKDMLTTPYVFDEDNATAMAKAGADIIVCHMGLTTGGSIGADTALKLEDCPALINSWSAAALKVNPKAIILAHGGPIAQPEDAEYILKNTEHCHGFYGASSMERLPTETALTEQTRRFKQITF